MNTSREDIVKPAPRLMRSRVLLGFVGLCLLLWCVKSIHHAMQPKYQGKTAEEWFKAIKTTYYDKYMPTWNIESDDPALIALGAMGENTLPVLRAEFARRESPLKNRFIKLLNNHLKQKLPLDSRLERHTKVRHVLFRVKTKADPLVPFFLDQMDSQDPETLKSAVLCLRFINTRPEVVLPVMIPLLGIRTNDVFYPARLCISSYTNDAQIALPLLLKATHSTNSFQRVISAFLLHHHFSQTNTAFIALFREILHEQPNELDDSVWLAGYLEKSSLTFTFITPLLELRRAKAYGATPQEVYDAYLKICPQGFQQP
ncbi:MAG: hypothetical protein ACO1QS_14845 [Verrucomicrobiota bacterium]